MVMPTSYPRATSQSLLAEGVNAAWKNWSGNIVHAPLIDGENYFSPTDRASLADVVRRAAAAGVTVRVSGQRHSQPPLVADDTRGAATAPERKTWLVDLACYADLGAPPYQRIVLDASGNTVTVNAGVREDELDAFLTRNNKLLRTVTAGGFFSIGGMTAVDVHGGTVDAPIFAETASAFTIMGPDGAVTTLDLNTPAENGWQPLQFARCSLGALGIVTSVTLEVLDRPLATSLRSGRGFDTFTGQADFVARIRTLLATHARLEIFFHPYVNKLLTLYWDVDTAPQDTAPNRAPRVPDACAQAGRNQFGAPLSIQFLDPEGQAALHQTNLPVIGRSLAQTDVDTCLDAIARQADQAAGQHNELWLDAALRVIFMSYFVELPSLDDAGLGLVWQGLNAVKERLQRSDAFLLVAPLEFRFVRGGDSALAGTYTTKPDATFVNLDMIGYVPADQPSRYPAELLHFFADVERAWVSIGGTPHNGKMYGFYDPGPPASPYSPPFNPKFLDALAKRRSDRIAAFDGYRRKRDPSGMFSNSFVNALLGA
jgi:FAD/FMN-containing dehydrogenase